MYNSNMDVYTWEYSMGSDSEPGDEPESEEDSAESNPYPIEGKYIDEEDRERYVSP